METLLCLLGLLAFIVGVVALAAGVTYAVVRLTPQREDKPADQAG
jgi:hypothetical protein